MPKAFSLASWNVEHFANPGSRVDRVVTFLSGLDSGRGPDVFALYEVEGKEVFDELVTKMPGYTFHITEGTATQEILLGVASKHTAFFTQRTEFNSGLQFLRPGALLTVTVDGKHYPMLFMHTKSGTEPLGLGLRDDMLRRALDFKRNLDTAAGGVANYLFLGDLNTMGMAYTYLRERDILADQEILKMQKFAVGRGMRLLSKDEPFTWSQGSTGSIPPSNLDQVVASAHMTFTSLSGFEVTVLGWPKEPTQSSSDKWIRDFSDHGCLYLEVQKG
ncbi:MAG: endonuclease/exonuclease/phosphatase family protein [Microbacterium sp.]